MPAIIIPANFTIAFNGNDFKGHDLLKIYLADELSKNEIKKAINDVITFFAVGFMNPDSDNPNFLVPEMRVEMQSKNDHLLKDSNGVKVCSNGACPGSNGYFRFMLNGQIISEYYFANQYGYETIFDPNEEKNLMHINCQDKKVECKLWDDKTCEFLSHKNLFAKELAKIEIKYGVY